MIQRYVVLKDFRYGWFLEDRLPGAFRFAGSAVYAFIRMDVELIGKCVFVFAHVLVDAVHGTYADTSRVEAIPAKASYRPWHRSLLTSLGCVVDLLGYAVVVPAFYSPALMTACLGMCGPKMHRGIRAPRSPGFGNSHKLCRTDGETLV